MSAALAGPADAATRYSDPTTVCSAPAGDPYLPFDRRGGHIELNQSYTPIYVPTYREEPISGKADFTVANDPVLLEGYDQTARLDWKNLTTGASGTVTIKQRPFGEMPVSVVKAVPTGKGRVQVTAHITNSGLAALGSSDRVQRASCVGAPFTVV